MTQDLSRTLHDATCALAESMMSLPQVECPVKEYFAPGVYLREMTIKKGVTVVGAVHKTEHLSILSKGILMITTEEGVITMTAPYTLHSKAGIKRAVYAVEDVVFTTVHPTKFGEDQKDELYRSLVDIDPTELMGGSNNKQMKLSGRHQEVLE